MGFRQPRVFRVCFLASVLLAAGCGGGGDEPPPAKPQAADAGAATALGRVAVGGPRASSEFVATYDRGEHLEPAPDGQTEILRGVVPDPVSTLTESGDPVGSDPGRLSIQYEGGVESERLARLVDDPVRAGNKVLAFTLLQANVVDASGLPTKGRVQMNAYDAGRLRAKEVRLTTRMYLPADVALLREMSTSMNWLTISEWWNDAGWTGGPYPFRVGVNIVKPSSIKGTALNFSATAQTLDRATNQWSSPLWQVVNRTVQVPTGKWVTLEYSFLEGDESTGRFYMAMTPDGGIRRVLIDVRGWTHHPQNPAPDGLTQLNPLKLYTSKSAIDHVRQMGGALSVYWDDLAIRLCRERGAEASSPCAPDSFGQGSRRSGSGSS